MTAEDMTGKVKGDFEVIRLDHIEENYSRVWLCRCVHCGKMMLKHGSVLNIGMPQHRRCDVNPYVPKEKQKTVSNDCKLCKYWKRLSCVDGYACHYCVDFGKRRERGEDGMCLSFEKRTGVKRRADAIVYGAALKDKGET